MRAFRTLSVLTISPLLPVPCLACRHNYFTFSALRPQCPDPRLSSSIPPVSKRPLSTSNTPNPADTQSAFSYRVAASFSGKGRRFNPKSDSYSFNAELENLEGPFTGRPSSGQDAFFTSRIGNSNHMAFGVADGVGGWSDSGFDSAHFSHGLCEWLARTAEGMSDAFLDHLKVKMILNNSYDKLVRDGSVEGGGSTACIAVARESGKVSIANLGDSGFAQLRRNKVKYYSNPQTHAFNTPYQLSIVPPRILALSRVFGGAPLHDMPKDAHEESLNVKHGDVLVFATDGVWDNLSPQDILEIVNRQMRGFEAWVPSNNNKKDEKGEGVGRVEVSDKIYELAEDGGIAVQVEDNLQTNLAVNIVGEAKAASQDTKRDGPFAKEIQKYYPNEEWHGGKVDDICVVVAVVVRDREGGRKSPKVNEVKKGIDNGGEVLGAEEGIEAEEGRDDVLEEDDGERTMENPDFKR